MRESLCIGRGYIEFHRQYIIGKVLQGGSLLKMFRDLFFWKFCIQSFTTLQNTCTTSLVLAYYIPSSQPQQQRNENSLLDLLGGGLDAPSVSQPPPISSNSTGGSDLLNLLDMPAQPVSTTGQTSSDPANLMSLLGGGGGGGGGGGVTGGGMGGLESLLGGMSNSAPSTSTSVPSPATSLAPAVPGEILYREGQCFRDLQYLIACLQHCF